jgi:hypothetical protein
MYLKEPQPGQYYGNKENDDKRRKIGSLLQLIQLFNINFL